MSLKLPSNKLPVWAASIVVVFFVSVQFLPTVQMAMAVVGLAAAVIGTILYGEERLPFVVGGLVLLLAGGVSNFHHLIDGMEWVLFVKLVALLTWVDYLNTSGYFDHLIEKYLPRKLKGFALMAMLLALSSFSAALIDEVNSIVLWYAVVRAIIGFTAKGKFKLKNQTWMVIVILLVSATNIGSQFLPLGNPVGIAISVLSGLTTLDFIYYAWVPGIITLVYFLLRVKMKFSKEIADFGKVAVEAKDFKTLDKMHDQYEMVEYEDPIGDKSTHEVPHKNAPLKTQHILFFLGILGLVLSEPIGSLFGLDAGTGLGLFVLALFATTMFIAGKYGRHNEVMLSELPLTTLFFIVFLFGIAHGLESTGLTNLAAEQIFHSFGSSQILIRVLIVVVGAITDGYILKASRYEVGGEVQNMIFYVNECGIMVMNDHLLTLSPKLQKVYDNIPIGKNGDSRTTEISPRVYIEKGELLATEVGFKVNKNIFLDFGLYDLRKDNDISYSSDFRKSNPNVNEYGAHAVCWFDYLSNKDESLVRNLPAGGKEGKVSDYCK